MESSSKTDSKLLLSLLFDLNLKESGTAKRIDEFEDLIEDSSDEIDENILDRIQGSIIGMALGDAVGAPVEFRPHSYLQANPVKDLQGGGTWSLEKGKFTDDTSMGLCLGASLILCDDFIPYDQLVRYKWWYQYGYMSSTGDCFDIGNATRESIETFIERQNSYLKTNDQISLDFIDKNRSNEFLNEFDVYCSDTTAAGNGALMRLAPVPLFFYRNLFCAIEFSGRSGEITHGDRRAYDSCRYYGALIVAAVRGFSKKQLTEPFFYKKHRKWFGENPLHPDVAQVANGSYLKQNGYDDGIRGSGFIVRALEAALWAFWSTNNFHDGVLAAVNLGDDTDTTAAIYGQLAGAFYGYKEISKKWCSDLYGLSYLKLISKWIYIKGDQWENKNSKKIQ